MAAIFKPNTIIAINDDVATRCRVRFLQFAIGEGATPALATPVDTKQPPKGPSVALYGLKAGWASR